MTHVITGAILGTFERPSGTFNPGSIAGLSLWLDSDDASSFTFSSGSIVSQWNDKSGNGKHFTQGVVASQPNRNGSQNGRTTVVFDGADDILNGPVAQIAAQPDTVFLAVKHVTRVSGAHLIDANANGRQLITGDSNWRIYAGSTVCDSGVVADTSWHVITAIFNSSSSKIRKDAAQIYGGADFVGGFSFGSATDSIYLGRGQGGTSTACQFAEILVYNSALGSTDLNSVESYLKTKWGTP